MLVCRARVDGLRTARALAASGHEAVLAPVLTIAALPFTAPRTLPDAVVATSGHAAGVLSPEQVASLRLRPAFAVGAQTAETLRDAGWTQVRIAEGRVAALADLLCGALPAPARLLYLAGRVRAPDLEDRLRQAGHAVEVVETYEARRAAPWPGDVVGLLRDAQLHACLHYSARSARLSIDFARQAGCSDAFARLRHLCLSEAVAAALRPVAAAPPTIAATHTEGGLAQALSTILG